MCCLFIVWVFFGWVYDVFFFGYVIFESSYFVNEDLFIDKEVDVDIDIKKRFKNKNS